LIAHSHLTDGGDMRNCIFQGTEDKFQTSLLYKALMAATAPPSDFAKMVWNNCAPPRVKFFIWLLVQNRIQSRSNLLKKSIITDAACALCLSITDTRYADTGTGTAIRRYGDFQKIRIRRYGKYIYF